MRIEDSQYEGNFDLDGSAAPLYFIASRVTVSRTSFSNENYGGSKCKEGAKGFGGFIFGMSDNQIELIDSSFEKVCALKGGAVFVGVFSELSVNKVEFKECRALERGGAIYATNTANCLVQNSNF